MRPSNVPDCTIHTPAAVAVFDNTIAKLLPEFVVDEAVEDDEAEERDDTIDEEVHVDDIDTIVGLAGAEPRADDNSVLPE